MPVLKPASLTRNRDNVWTPVELNVVYKNNLYVGLIAKQQVTKQVFPLSRPLGEAVKFYCDAASYATSGSDPVQL